jgi:hypothetical protein
MLVAIQPTLAFLLFVAIVTNSTAVVSVSMEVLRLPSNDKGVRPGDRSVGLRWMNHYLLGHKHLLYEIS